MTPNLLITGTIALVEFICLIITAVNVAKIKDVQCQPFQNKKPDYPDKVIELLQSIVSNQQHQSEDIKKMTEEMNLLRNAGIKPGMKSTDTAQHEELIKIHKEQTELLKKLLESSNGEDKKKMLEKLRQAAEIINNLEEN